MAFAANTDGMRGIFRALTDQHQILDQRDRLDAPPPQNTDSGAACQLTLRAITDGLQPLAAMAMMLLGAAAVSGCSFGRCPAHDQTPTG